MKDYLIPANSKKSLLIFSLFKMSDLILLGTGAGVTMLLIMFAPLSNTLFTILALSPGMIASFLVMPVANYHNVLNVIITAYKFLTTEQDYEWKGWCYKDGE